MDSRVLIPSKNKLSFGLKNRFHRLAESDTNSDCEFIVGPQRTVIKGHKVIFCTASEVFQAMFYGQLREDKRVIVADLEPYGFKGMKTFIYTGEITFTSVLHAVSTFVAGRKYLIPNLESECVNFIKGHLQPSDVLEFRDCCKMNRISGFDDLCCKIIREDTDKVLASEYFISADIDSIELILQSPSLKLKSEIEVFDLFERWALAQVEREKISANQIASRFNNLKRHIRFLTLSGDEIVSRVAESALLTQEEKYAIALNKIKFNQKLMSENISMLQISRKFKSLVSAANNYYKKSHMFEIPIDKINVKIPEITLMNAGSGAHNADKVKAYCHNLKKCIIFKVKVVGFCNHETMIKIKTKFTVLAANKCDNLLFENEIKTVVCNSYYGREYDSIVEVIPKSSLRDSRFLSIKNLNINTVSIEGSFSIELFNL